MTTERLIPYDSGDIEREAGLAQAKELRATGRFARVIVRERKPEDGKRYVRVYVQRKGTP